MAESIRGLTVEISADASSFNKEMSSMRKAAQQSQTELNALQKSLELEFDSDKFARAQKVAQNAIDQTAANADALRRRLDYLENTGNIDTDQYRKLKAELAKTELQAQQLEKQLEKINQIKFDAISARVTKVGDAISNVGKTLAPFSAAALAAGTAAATLGVKTAATGAELDDLSLRLGISAEKVQEYQYVTAQAGVEWDTFEKALIKARAAIVDLSAGTINNASKALQSLGLRVENFDSKEAMFDGIIDALSNMEDKTLQTAYANEIFGDKIANQMLPYLNAGTDAINQFKSEFETIGALSNEQVAALSGVVKIINIVVGVVEDAVNFVIGIINKLIDGVNSSLGWLGVHIDRIAEVKLRIDTSEIKDMDDVNAIIDSTAPTQPKDNGGNGGTVYDNGNGTGTSGDIYNYDNSTKNTTQNITVTIQNYAAEVDTDKLVREINMKLAEAM